MFAKAFGLFVSSTFQDFGEERRLLQERVFPGLEAYCAKEGFGFRAVDMRWGVNGDAQLNQRTAEICLGEVIEAKGYPAPNLLILIGDRYGWTPLPFAIARDEFQALRTWLITQNEREAIADFDRVYTLDENHLVPGGLTTSSADRIGAYTLRSREDELIELRSAEDWGPVEARLLKALQEASWQLHTSGQLRDIGLEKYRLSLTEQEIRKGLENLAASDGQAAAKSIAWVRTTDTAEPPIRNLVDAVQRALPIGNVLRAEFQASSDSYGERFVAQITARLITAIDAQIADFKDRALAPDFAFQTERAIHAAFAAERLRVFVGRASNLSAIGAHIDGDARHPLVLTGSSGAGKTALMAKAAAETKGKVVQRFVGASATSANQRNLMISVIEDLAALGVTALPARWEDDGNRFVNQVRDILAAIDQPVAIFIDALDQLRAPYRPMWLPPQLHPQVKLIVSVLDDEAFAAERAVIQGLRRSLPTEAFLAMEPLSKKDGADILAGLKRDAQRGLSPGQEAYVLERFETAGASPLYLHIAFAVARRWRSTNDPRARGLASDVTALIGQLLDELSSVHHHELLLVRRGLGLIAAGRDGLSESEAIAVLSRDTDVMAAVSSERFGAKTDRLPDSVWVRLKRSLRALLVEKDEEGEPLITFFHRQVAEVVRARFYEPEKAALHKALAAYFDPPAEHPDAGPPWTRRGFIELPFQLFHAGLRERLDTLLTDPAWVDKKVRSLGGAREVIADFDAFRNPGDETQLQIVRVLRMTSHILAQDPVQFLPQLHLRASPASRAKFTRSLLGLTTDGALVQTHCTSEGSLEVARYVYNEPLLQNKQIPGWKRMLDAMGPPEYADIVDITVTSATSIAGITRQTAFLWRPFSGEAVVEAQIARASKITTLADGRILIWHGPDAQIWSPDDGSVASVPASLRGEYINALTPSEQSRLQKYFRQHDIPTTMVSTPDLVSIGKIGVLNNTEYQSALSSGHFLIFNRSGAIGFPENASTESSTKSNGRFIAVWINEAVDVFDLNASAHAARFSCQDKIEAVVALPGGILAAIFQTGGINGGIAVWDSTSGALLATLLGHELEETALQVMQNGCLVSSSADGTVRVWDIGGVTISAPRAVRARRRAVRMGVKDFAPVRDGRVASVDGGAITLWAAPLNEPLMEAQLPIADAAHIATLSNGLMAILDKSRNLKLLGEDEEVLVVEGLPWSEDQIRQMMSTPDGG